jgi:hypothetical protein
MPAELSSEVCRQCKAQATAEQFTRVPAARQALPFHNLEPRSCVNCKRLAAHLNGIKAFEQVTAVNSGLCPAGRFASHTGYHTRSKSNRTCSVARLLSSWNRKPCNSCFGVVNGAVQHQLHLRAGSLVTGTFQLLHHLFVLARSQTSKK